MCTCRLAFNYVVVETWTQKFAAGKVCMHPMFVCNNICQNANRKKMHRFVSWCKILLTNEHVRTHAIAWKIWFDGSSTPKLHSRLGNMLNNNAECHLLLFHKKKPQCHADFHRPKHCCQIWHYVWDGENRPDINFLDAIHPQAAWSVFEHIKARVPAKFGARTPPRS